MSVRTLYFSIAALLAACITTNVQAAKLVVMGVNLNGAATVAPAGSKVFTIGFDTQGANGNLAIQNLLFTDGADTFIRQVTPGGAQTRQQIQDTIDNNGSDVNNLLVNDSWWWVSPDGNLTMTDFTDPEDPIVSVIQKVWTPFGGGITGGTASGADMGFTGTFGPFPTDAAPGIYPLLQIRTTGNLDLTGVLAIGSTGFNVLGGANNGAHAILDFNAELIRPVPEPSTLVLAAGGLLTLAVVWHRRRAA